VYRQIFELPGFAEATFDEDGHVNKEFEVRNAFSTIFWPLFFNFSQLFFELSDKK
jgi:hypothetical protein